MRSPLRIVGRKKVMTCVQCNQQKPWPHHFVNSLYAECLACWLRNHPSQIEPMQTAINLVTKGPLSGSNADPT